MNATVYCFVNAMESEDGYKGSKGRKIRFVFLRFYANGPQIAAAFNLYPTNNEGCRDRHHAHKTPSAKTKTGTQCFWVTEKTHTKREPPKSS
jgi:hypothetical protein